MAVTINTQNHSVFGNKRVNMVNLDIGADADTWATGFTTIDFATLEPPDETACGVTWSGGTLTFQTGGAKAGCHLFIVGI